MLGAGFGGEVFLILQDFVLLPRPCHLYMIILLTFKFLVLCLIYFFALHIGSRIAPYS